MKSLFDLTGKTAVITGGAGWLGTPMTEALAAAGATVVCVDYNKDALKTLTNEMSRKNLNVVPVQADAFDNDAIIDFIDTAAGKDQRLDILVNCAYAGPTPELDQVIMEDIDKGFHNGASAYLIACKQAAKYMKRNNGGSIINFASMYGMVSCDPAVYEGLMAPNSIVYHSAKGAVIQMTRYMAVFWAKYNIRVNAVSPGPFPNETAQEKYPEFIKRLSRKAPLGRIGRPEEIQGVILFLASNASTYVTGQNIAIDGGWTAL